jgi:uncharacterized membrane protein
VEQQTWNDQRVEQIVGKMLQVGVLLSALVVFLGALMYLSKFGHVTANYHQFRSEPPELRDPLAITRNAFHLDSRAVIQLGLLLLIATPVARVAFSIAAFVRERDATYIFVTLIVLAILLYNLLGLHI